MLLDLSLLEDRERTENNDPCPPSFHTRIVYQITLDHEHNINQAAGLGEPGPWVILFGSRSSSGGTSPGAYNPYSVSSCLVSSGKHPVRSFRNHSLLRKTLTSSERRKQKIAENRTHMHRHHQAVLLKNILGFSS